MPGCLGVVRVRVPFLSFPLLSVAKRDVMQIGLGDSETEHTGDESGDMGENLSVANLGGVYVDLSACLPVCLSAFLPSTEVK